MDLNELYDSTINEFYAESMTEYVEARKTSAELTAQSTYTLIKPHILGEADEFLIFFKKLAVVSSLFDSCVDLKKDLKKGLYSFDVTGFDIEKLGCNALKEGFNLALFNPSLIKNFSTHAKKFITYNH